jgi:hypothetical protein
MLEYRCLPLKRVLAIMVLVSLLFGFGTAHGQEEKEISFSTVKAKMSNLAADGVGINTHLNFKWTLYYSHYEDLIKPRLVELGIKHIRDHFGDEKAESRYAELAHKYGIKLLLINNDEATDLVGVKNEVKRLNGLNPSKLVVELIEPANERDNGWKKDWARLCTYLTDYKQIFKGDKATASIPLLGPSFADTKNSAVNFGGVCKGVSDNMDLANLHAYSGLYPESPYAGGWGISFNNAIERYRAISAGKPIVESESGYKMAEGIDGHPAVSQRTAAKYSPRLVLERLRAGVTRVYFYQLINALEDFGMLNDDGTPRLHYTSIKNFISLMKDEGPAFTTGTLSYALKGNTKNIHQMLFQKRNGKYMLLLWQSVNGSDKGTAEKDYIDIENPEAEIKLILAHKASSIKIYRPSFNQMPDGNGVNPVTALKNKTIIDLSVPDHLLIVEITLK